MSLKTDKFIFKSSILLQYRAMDSLDLARTRYPNLGSSDDLSSMTVDTGQVVVNNSLNGNKNQSEIVVMAGIVLLASSLFIFTGIIVYFTTIKW